MEGEVVSHTDIQREDLVVPSRGVVNFLTRLHASLCQPHVMYFLAPVRCVLQAGGCSCCLLKPSRSHYGSTLLFVLKAVLGSAPERLTHCT